ncbi:RNA polymerase factor sigma-54 [Neptunomonas qingdaonensis]|uniref:RNA polymerase sigma-54 factor n=1 Tax=Neptunomonas qingdaonensis TaxID=1045558 RepID=A0A1I2UHR5_9GAMM|nr:RNA polymerase factor sigma-54 [Neptunomonas qingdaonensis]SFG76675.1 RNA polymerase, sigma 54 subunit, RpoN/SigL [Neptunomonas qingdaonensis]
MKQSLQLKMGQHLTMTPQLQQAIRLLQLSTLDLQHEIQEALDSNPMLETGDESDEPSEAQREITTPSEDHDFAESNASKDENIDNSAVDQWSDSIPEDLSTDSSWEDTFQSTTSSGQRDDDSFFESNDSAEETLQDHLNWQLNLTPMSPADQLIAEAIIDGIDNEGYLRTTTEEILEHFKESEPDLFAEAELDEVEAVLHRIQQFDPPGVASRDLGECLSIQLRQLPADTPLLSQALTLCKQYIHLLGTRDYKQLLRKLRLKEDQLQAIIVLIQSLNPYPGSMISSSKAEYVIPDVYVEKFQGVWTVRLNQESSPNLRINTSYADLIRRADSSADNTYLKNHLQEARWFIKSLQSRNETLLKVSSQIIERQSEFLEHGEEAMKPMVLHDIAEAVEMHESTISRVTTQKYMHTPRGIFELKYFFSSHVSTNDGGAASSTAIRAVIKKMIAAESTTKPLSDNKIAQLLDQEGIQVARRTVAKYREAMGIAPSNERKCLV